MMYNTPIQAHPQHLGKLLKDNNTATQAHPQRTITTFFSPITPIMLQVNQGIHKWVPNQDITKGLQ